MDKADKKEVRIKGLTEKYKELEIKYEQLEGKKSTKSNRKEDNGQREARNVTSEKGSCSSYVGAESIFQREEGLSSREINILKKWTNSKREERRNFVIKEFLHVTKEIKVTKSVRRDRDRRKRVVKRQSKLQYCNIVIRQSEDVLVIKIECKEDKKQIMRNKYKFKGEKFSSLEALDVDYAYHLGVTEKTI